MEQLLENDSIKTSVNSEADFSDNLVNMRLVLTIFIISAILLVSEGQHDGRYRPPTTKRAQVNDGRYTPVNDGRYRPNNDGKYRPLNDGKYIPQDDGKYIHKDVPGGAYAGDGGQYTGGGGQYIGNKDKIVGGGQYTGNGAKYSGSESSGTSGYGSGGSEGQAAAGSERQAAGGSEGQAAGGSGSASASSGSSNKNSEGLISDSQSLRPSTAGKGTGEGKSGWKIIRDHKDAERDGYYYLFETENGILAEESGRIEDLTPEDEGLRSQGFYEYTGDDGLLYRVDYVADDRGFLPQGDHIPKTPIAIQKLVAYLATKPPETKKK